MRGANFWQTPAGQEITRRMQVHYADIILALKEHAFHLRETKPEKSENLQGLADDLWDLRKDAEKAVLM